LLQLHAEWLLNSAGSGRIDLQNLPFPDLWHFQWIDPLSHGVNTYWLAEDIEPGGPDCRNKRRKDPR
jgi:hypothetical protein